MSLKMRPKSKFRQLSEAEKAIGRRVAECRKIRGCDQRRLAEQIGISRDQLASVEVGRVALTTVTALKIAEALQVNLLWLAEGWGTPKRFILPPPKMLETAEKEKYFKQAFDVVLQLFFYKDALQCLKDSREFYEGVRLKTAQLEKSPPQGRDVSVPKLSFIDFANEELRDFSEVDLDSLSSEDKNRIQQQIGFLKNCLAGDAMLPGLGLSNNVLTDKTTSGKNDGVKSEWFKLKKKIQAATSDVGGKSQLAAFLRVDLTQLSKWLTDSDSAREPGADYTLRMQAWVNDPQRQK